MVRTIVLLPFLATCAQGQNQTKKYSRGLDRSGKNAYLSVATFTDDELANVPDKIDWSQNATTSIKDQGYCGSCWAFSAVSSIESAVFMSTGVLPSALSIQQVVACDEGDDGCDGGLVQTAFEYVKNDGGLDTEDHYPDTSSSKGSDGDCKNDHNHVVTVTGYQWAVPQCEDDHCDGWSKYEGALKAALVKYGPLSVCVNADWDDYRSGVYKDADSCSGGYYDRDHCVQLVGYDATSSDGPGLQNGPSDDGASGPGPGSSSYWKVRNSWGSDWGENGFIRLPMGENACGIASEAFVMTADYVNAPAPEPSPEPTPTPSPPTPSPPTPSPPGSYQCVNSQCVSSSDSGSVSMDICTGVCAPATYRCISNQCQPSTDGGLPWDTCSGYCGGALSIV